MSGKHRMGVVGVRVVDQLRVGRVWIEAIRAVVPDPVVLVLHRDPDRGVRRNRTRWISEVVAEKRPAGTPRFSVSGRSRSVIFRPFFDDVLLPIGVVVTEPN